MKSFSEMTNREKAEITFKAIKERQEKREAGKLQAQIFLIDNAQKACRRAKKAKRRGNRSL